MKRFQIALLLTIFATPQLFAPANFSGKATFAGKANFGAAAGGGGGGVAGPPGLLAIGTNTGTSISTLSVSLTVSGANTVLFFAQDWYHATASQNTPTWNGSATGVTLWTNGDWFSGGGHWTLYYLANPTAGTHAAAVSWSVAVDEANFFPFVVTNWSGSFDVAQTNLMAVTTEAVTNVVASQTKDLMVDYSVLDTANTETPTGVSGSTVIAYTAPGNFFHSGAILTRAGTAGTSTNGASWSGLGSPENVANMAGGLIGF